MPYNKSEPETIQAMFGSIAAQYDRANAVLSLGLHRYWNRSLVRHVSPGESLLDLCAGTGDIAFAYLKDRARTKAVLVDFSPEMLACAKDKAKTLNLLHHELSYIQADVQELPLADDMVSRATIAYGIRNVKEPQRCFAEVYRVLRPGGVFGILELTQPANPLIRWGHNLYLRAFLPPMGKWLTRNQEAYRYLCRSIEEFVPPVELENKLRAVGFKEIRRYPLTFGTATILIGLK